MIMFSSLLEYMERICSTALISFLFIPFHHLCHWVCTYCTDIFFSQLWVVFFYFAYLVVFIVCQPISFMLLLAWLCCIPESVGLSWGAQLGCLESVGLFWDSLLSFVRVSQNSLSCTADSVPQLTVSFWVVHPLPAMLPGISALVGGVQTVLGPVWLWVLSGPLLFGGYFSSLRYSVHYRSVFSQGL